MAQPWDYIAKLVCIGDSGTGKSSLTIRLCEGRFIAHHDVTIGVEFGSRIVPVGKPKPNTNTPEEGTNSNPPQKRMKLSLWDTAGQETYKSITRSYFRGASGALLVFDITRRSTFLSATSWLHDLRQIAEDGIVVVLVGNKTDLCSSNTTTSPDQQPRSGGSGATANGSVAEEHTGLSPTTENNKRAVSAQEAEQWCLENHVLRYVETSAKSGQGVENAFLEVAQRIYENVERGRYDLNDRRSGVKGPGAAGGGSGAGGGRGSGGGGVRLGMNDVGASTKAVAGGCC